MGELPRVGVITIQGGGALAVDLIGQLQGLVGPAELLGKPTGDAGVAPAAIAGTSAGAIIAALFWLGYSPREILDELRRLFAPDRVEHFFGFGFPAFVRLTEAVANASSLARWWRLAWPGRERWFLLPVWLPWQLLTLAVGVPACLLRLALARGLFRGEGFVAELDLLVRRSRLVRPFAAALPAGRRVTFGDIAEHADPGLVMPFFLIATDVTAADMRRICSFDPRDTGIAVAGAVRASAGFPLFFTPIALGKAGDCYVDGGVVSNFPSWVFAGGYRPSLLTSGNPAFANAAFLPWVHYGLRLSGPSAGAAGEAMGFLRRLAGLLTGAARTRLETKLAQTVIRRRDVEPTPATAGTAPAGVLDFAALADAGRVQAAFDRGRRDGQRAFRAGDHALPPAADLAPILAVLVEQVTALLRPHLLPGSVVRANIFVRDGDHLLLRFAHGFAAGDPDRGMRLALNEGITGIAFTSRQTVLANLRDHKQQQLSPAGRADPFLQQAGAPSVRSDRSWLMSMPIFDLTEAWPAWPEHAAHPLALEFLGPTFGVLNVDAAVDYGTPGAPDADPAAGQRHPLARSIADAMKLAALRCSRYFGQAFEADPG